MDRPPARRLAATACLAVAALAIACMRMTTPSVAAAPTLNPIGLAGCLDRQPVPIQALMWALSHDSQVYGYGMACNPNVPFNPVSNPMRSHLALRNPNVPYHPMFNALVWKCGCP